MESYIFDVNNDYLGHCSPGHAKKVIAELAI